MLDKVYQENQRIMYLGDKENSNVDSTLVSTIFCEQRYIFMHMEGGILTNV